MKTPTSPPLAPHRPGRSPDDSFDRLGFVRGPNNTIVAFDPDASRLLTSILEEADKVREKLTPR